MDEYVFVIKMSNGKYLNSYCEYDGDEIKISSTKKITNIDKWTYYGDDSYFTESKACEEVSDFFEECLSAYKDKERLSKSRDFYVFKEDIYPEKIVKIKISAIEVETIIPTESR